jgi:hypothetical protein
MLVTRQCDTGRYNWTSSKLGAIHQSTASPRMSDLEPLTTQPDWREQYSQYIPTAGSTLLSPSLNQSLGSHEPESSASEQHYGVRPQLEHRHTLAQLDTRLNVSQAPLIERPDSAPGNVQQAITGQEALGSPEPGSISSGPILPDPSTAQAKSEMCSNHESESQSVVLKDENEDDEEDDYEMLDQEDSGGLPQTEAERRAERRKMKRFRYVNLPVLLHHSVIDVV